VSKELPPTAHANGGKCILRDILKVGGNFAHVGVGGVGICNWWGRIIPELFFDVPEVHVERKNSDKKLSLQSLRLDGTKSTAGEAIPFQECPPISCICQLVEGTELGDFRLVLESPDAILIVKHLLKAHLHYLGNVNLVVTEYAN
jgi:hypothetical protein